METSEIYYAQDIQLSLSASENLMLSELCRKHKSKRSTMLRAALRTMYNRDKGNNPIMEQDNDKLQALIEIISQVVELLENPMESRKDLEEIKLKVNIIKKVLESE